jgi:hypothetical protein
MATASSTLSQAELLSRLSAIATTHNGTALTATDGTITGQPLTDGRVAYTCLWQADLAAAFDRGDIKGVEELTGEQLADLTPQPSQP